MAEDTEHAGHFSLPEEVLLEKGNYELTETKSPEGYTTKGPWEINIADDGTVSVKPENVEMSTDGQKITLTITNKFNGYKFIPEKFAYIDGKDVSLENAEFTITKWSKEWTEQLDWEDKTTDKVIKSGTVINLPNGYYKVKESKAPEYYELDAKEYSFYISGGKAYTKEGEEISIAKLDDSKGTDYFYQESGKFTLHFMKYDTLKPFDVTLTKVDKATGNPLGNAIFEIRDKNNFGTDDDSTYIGEGTSSSVDGKITFKVKGTENAYELEAGKTYYVKEITAPDGYELLEKVFEIVIGEDGTVTVDGTKQENVLIGGNDHNHIDLGTVDNQPKNHLPETGGNGTRNFLIAGWISIIFAGISLIYVYNKNKGVA